MAIDNCIITPCNILLQNSLNAHSLFYYDYYVYYIYFYNVLMSAVVARNILLLGNPMKTDTLILVY